MIKNPERWIAQNKYKFNIIIPQFEEIEDFKKYISESKKIKRKVTFDLNPKTVLIGIKPYRKEMDYVLILTVHPGYYGSKFLLEPLQKIKEI